MRVFQITELDKKTLKKAHKTADKILDKPKAKSNIAKWAKDKGMDPEGAVYAIATNMAKKKTNEEGFLDKVKGALSSVMPKDMDDLVAWVNKNLRSKGTQWIYKNVGNEFGAKHFTKFDVDKAINIVMKRG